MKSCISVVCSVVVYLRGPCCRVFLCGLLGLLSGCVCLCCYRHQGEAVETFFLPGSKAYRVELQGLRRSTSSTCTAFDDDVSLSARVCRVLVCVRVVVCLCVFCCVLCLRTMTISFVFENRAEHFPLTFLRITNSRGR